MTHTFEVRIAKTYGLNAAIVLELLRTWIAHNKANRKNTKEGMTWTYNSTKSWGELLPYMTEKQIRTAIEVLLSAGLVVKSNFNENTYDRTLWYALTAEGECICPVGQMEVPPRANGNAPQGKCVIQSDKPIDKPVTESGEVKSEPKKNPTELPPIPLLLNTPAFQDAWLDWQTYRKDRKMALTATTAKSQFQKLEGWGVERAIQAIRDAISNNWQGVFEPRVMSMQRTGTPPPPGGRPPLYPQHR